MKYECKHIFDLKNSDLLLCSIHQYSGGISLLTSGKVEHDLALRLTTAHIRTLEEAVAALKLQRGD